MCTQSRCVVPSFMPLGPDVSGNAGRQPHLRPVGRRERLIVGAWPLLRRTSRSLWHRQPEPLRHLPRLLWRDGLPLLHDTRALGWTCARFAREVPAPHRRLAAQRRPRRQWSVATAAHVQTSTHACGTGIHSFRRLSYKTPNPSSTSAPSPAVRRKHSSPQRHRVSPRGHTTPVALLQQHWRTYKEVFRVARGSSAHTHGQRLSSL